MVDAASSAATIVPQPNLTRPPALHDCAGDPGRIVKGSGGDPTPRGV
jgi:hypothetical protein